VIALELLAGSAITAQSNVAYNSAFAASVGAHAKVTAAVPAKQSVGGPQLTLDDLDTLLSVLKLLLLHERAVTQVTCKNTMQQQESTIALHSLWQPALSRQTSAHQCRQNLPQTASDQSQPATPQHRFPLGAEQPGMRPHLFAFTIRGCSLCLPARREAGVPLPDVSSVLLLWRH
jgi:hypothetical protein